MMRRTVLAALAALPSLAHGQQFSSPRPMPTDSHAHIFLRGLTMTGTRRYTPDYDATLTKYLNMLQANGVARGVLIQPSFLGEDNSFLLTALAQQPSRLRGVIVVAPSTSRDALAELHAQGVRGVRLNLIGLPDPDLSSSGYRQFLRALADLGWHIEVQAEARRLRTLQEAINGAGVALVVDHFGRPDPTLGVTDPAFTRLLERGRDQNVYVKLSGPYRLASGTKGEAIAAEAAPLLLSALGPERLVWGSDWPHTQFEKVASPTRARRLLDLWVPDAPSRALILSDTPDRLFGFAPASGRSTPHPAQRSA